MKSGRRDRKVRIESLSVSPNAAGIETETWNLLCEEFAQVTFQTSGNSKSDESFEAEQTTTVTSVAFRVRANSKTKAVKTKDRIAFDGRWYQVASVAMVPGGRPHSVLINTEDISTNPVPVV